MPLEAAKERMANAIIYVDYSRKAKVIAFFLIFSAFSNSNLHSAGTWQGA